MFLFASALASTVLASQTPATHCSSWSVGRIDHTYQGQQASHDCQCASSVYRGAACSECTSQDTPLTDGGVATATRCLRLDTGGCSSAPGLSPLLAGLSLFALCRPRRSPERSRAVFRR